MGEEEVKNANAQRDKLKDLCKTLQSANKAKNSPEKVTTSPPKNTDIDKIRDEQDEDKGTDQMDVGPVVTGSDWQMNEKVMSQNMTTDRKLVGEVVLTEEEKAIVAEQEEKKKILAAKKEEIKENATKRMEDIANQDVDE